MSMKEEKMQSQSSSRFQVIYVATFFDFKHDGDIESRKKLTWNVSNYEVYSNELFDRFYYELTRAALMLLTDIGEEICW